MNTTDTIPESILDTIRNPTAMCTCGHEASDHSNRLGACTGHHPGMVACSCERWTWSPDDDARMHARTPREAARIEQAHEIMATLKGAPRRAALGRVEAKGRVERRLVALGLLDDGPTLLGREILRGWACERCDGWHAEGEEHYSAEHCNDTGTDVMLCKPCATKANEEGPRA